MAMLMTTRRDVRNLPFVCSQSFFLRFVSSLRDFHYSAIAATSTTCLISHQTSLAVLGLRTPRVVPHFFRKMCYLTNRTCRRGVLCTSLLETRQPQGRRKSTSTLGPGQQASLHRHCCKCLTCQVAATVLGLRTPRVLTQNWLPYICDMPAQGCSVLVS